MLGLGSSLSKGGLVTPGIVTDSLVLKHNYAAGGVVPVSDGAAYFGGANTDAVTGLGNCPTGSFSIVAWVNHNGINAETIYSANGYDSINFRCTDTSAGKLQIFIGGAGKHGQTDSAHLTANKWHHVAATWVAGDNNPLLYVDGILRASSKTGTLSAPIGASAGVIGKMSDTTSNPFTGEICNVGIWSGTILTAPQIKSIMWKNYAGLTSSETTGLVSWWNLSADANDNHGSNDGTLS